MLERALSRRMVSWVAVLMFAVPSVLLAQAGTIVGSVTDRATQQPLAQVRLIVPGTTLETQTNAQGEYRIANVPAGRHTVGLFKIGFKAMSDTVQVVAGQTATLNFQMTASLVTLSEVVVTGTAGNQERRAQAATVASLDAAELVKTAPVGNVAELLQSRIPGVAISSNSGSVGDGEHRPHPRRVVDQPVEPAAALHRRHPRQRGIHQQRPERPGLRPVQRPEPR